MISLLLIAHDYYQFKPKITENPFSGNYHERIELIICFMPYACKNTPEKPENSVFCSFSQLFQISKNKIGEKDIILFPSSIRFLAVRLFHSEGDQQVYNAIHDQSNTDDAGQNIRCSKRTKPQGKGPV